MSESIGQRLKKEREYRYLTLEKVSEITRIRVVFLQALEADDYSVMPSAAQGRGFLRNYAEFLDLNIDEMIAEIQRNAPPPVEVSGPLPQVNLVETEVPPLTDTQDEKPARPFWHSPLWVSSLFARRPKAESAPEAESIEEPLAPVVDELKVEEPKTRGRKKKKTEEVPQPVIVEAVTQQEQVTEIRIEESSLPVEAEQIEVTRRGLRQEDTKTSLISRLGSLFRFRFNKKESDSIPEPEEDIEPILEPVIPSLPADVIFAEIGRQLRERRELISLTLDEVERHTRLRVVFIKALEEGRFDKLPSPVQTRGMLANYATFLDLDADTILLRFADGLQARHREKYAETPREKIQMEVTTSMPFLRSFIAGDLIFGVVMISILVALAIWGVGRVVGSQETNAEATAPSIVDVLGSTSVPTGTLDATFVPVGDNPLATSINGDPLTSPDVLLTSGVDANVIVSVFAVERAFIRISVDGEQVFEGRIAPGETMTFQAENQVVILTGNAAALRITYNGRDLGLMGGVGEVVSRVYLVSGVATPTATIPPTATSTPNITLTPSITVSPTNTPSTTD